MTGIPGQGLTYTSAIADVICERLENGETLTAICKDIGTPASTVVKWSNKNHDGFGERYARARELGWNVVADQVIDIADEETTPDMIGQQRNRIDTRKWLLSKRLPKTFGDKVATTNQTIGADGNPVDPVPLVQVYLPANKRE